MYERISLEKVDKLAKGYIVYKPAPGFPVPPKHELSRLEFDWFEASKKRGYLILPNRWRENPSNVWDCYCEAIGWPCVEVREKKKYASVQMLMHTSGVKIVEEVKSLVSRIRSVCPRTIMESKDASWDFGSLCMEVESVLIQEAQAVAAEFVRIGREAMKTAVPIPEHLL